MLPNIETILYCSALGPNAKYVFQWAVSIAERYSARIVALHVIETLNARQRALVEGYSGRGSLTELIAHAEEEAKSALPERVRRFCAAHVDPKRLEKISLDVKIAEGHVAEQILRHVELTKADIVVMGAHAEKSVIDRLIGGTTRTIVKSSPVPVLTIQIPEGS